MEDEWDYLRTRSTVALVVAGAALALVILLGVAVGYVAMTLDKETGRLQAAQAELQAAQTELKEAVQALQARAPAESNATPAGATVPAVPSVPDAPAPPPPSANAAPSPPTSVPATGAAPKPAGPAQAAPASDRYSVRIFAAVEGSNKNKLERFVNVVRSLGFDVDVSDTNISDSMNSSILYQPSALNTANKLANSLKARYPSLKFEMNTGAVNDNLKRVLIVSLNQDALN